MSSAPASLAPALGPSDLHVWRAATDVSDTTYSVCRRRLTPAERARADRMGAAPERRFTVMRAVQRTVLAGYLGVDPGEVAITRRAGGKPEVRRPRGAPPLHFSVTRTDGLALCAVARMQLGVDVERVRRVADAPAIVRRAAGEAEAERFLAVAEHLRDREFLERWTAWEALGKATGDGLGILADRARDDLAAEVRHLDVGLDHVACVAVVGSDGVRVAQLDWVPA